jgi:hypothetical protein
MRISGKPKGAGVNVSFIQADGQSFCGTKCPFGKRAGVNSYSCHKCDNFVWAERHPNIVRCIGNLEEPVQKIDSTKVTVSFRRGVLIID